MRRTSLRLGLFVFSQPTTITNTRANDDLVSNTF
jgi:hypothetical protein